MKRLLLGLFASLSAAAIVPLAGAHAFLESSVPAAGSTIHRSPSELKLRFTQRIEPAFSEVRVLDRGGKQVDKGDPRVDGADATLLVVSLPLLANGKYRVKWRVLSVDSHVIEGGFTFDVAP